MMTISIQAASVNGAQEARVQQYQSLCSQYWDAIAKGNFDQAKATMIEANHSFREILQERKPYDFYLEKLMEENDAEKDRKMAVICNHLKELDLSTPFSQICLLASAIKLGKENVFEIAQQNPAIQGYANDHQKVYLTWGHYDPRSQYMQLVLNWYEARDGVTAVTTDMASLLQRA